METKPTIDTTKRLIGWITVGLSIAVAIICIVRRNASASNLLGCAFAALAGIIFVGESVSAPDDGASKNAPNLTPKRMRWIHWVFIALLFGAGLLLGYFG